jgi:hypothetical protein
VSYLAAWDVRRAKMFGRCEAKTGIISFARLVSDAMPCEPYCTARGVFLIIDNGPSHRGLPSVRRFQGNGPQIVVVHLAIHASWLNQIHIYVLHSPTKGTHAQRLIFSCSFDGKDSPV